MSQFVTIIIMVWKRARALINVNQGLHPVLIRDLPLFEYWLDTVISILIIILQVFFQDQSLFWPSSKPYSIKVLWLPHFKFTNITIEGHIITDMLILHFIIQTLRLKVGAPVIFTANCSGLPYLVNGLQGEICGCDVQEKTVRVYVPSLKKEVQIGRQTFKEYVLIQVLSSTIWIRVK